MLQRLILRICSILSNESNSSSYKNRIFTASTSWFHQLTLSLNLSQCRSIIAFLTWKCSELSSAKKSDLCLFLIPAMSVFLLILFIHTNYLTLTSLKCHRTKSRYFIEVQNFSCYQYLSVSEEINYLRESCFFSLRNYIVFPNKLFYPGLSYYVKNRSISVFQHNDIIVQFINFLTQKLEGQHNTTLYMQMFVSGQERQSCEALMVDRKS